MNKAPTIYDVAKRAGVSKSLVSLVLQGSPRVSDEKRQAVLDAVDELNYTPSHLAASLAGTRTRSIGVLIDEFSNLWYVRALAGLRSALADDGYTLSIADTALNEHLDRDSVEVFRSLRVDGVVIAGEMSQEAADRLNIPGVVLGTRITRPAGMPVVAGDEEAGGRLATEHLVDLGHRGVVCVSAPGESAGARERGYREAMASRGLEGVVVRAKHWGEREAWEALRHHLAGHGTPTAVFGANDTMAIGVFGALRERGLRVPEDVSVVGYDNSPLAAYEYLALTSVDGDALSMGRTAGELLLEMLEHPLSRPGDVLLPPKLVVRGSTAPPGLQGSVA